MFNDAVKQGLDALEIVKDQLQKAEDRDYKEIVRAIALLTDNDYKLYAERAGLMRTPTRGMPESD